MVRFILVVATMGLFATLLQAGEPQEVYRRATVLEDRVGKTYLRAAYEVPLTILVDCESNRRGCTEQRVYPEVLRVEFVSERREAGTNEVFQTEERAGTIHAAIAFSQEDREAFREELENRLRRLSAQAFVKPFAGWQPMEPPFDSSTLSSRSELPAWACFESSELSIAASFYREVEEGPEGPVVISSGSRTYRRLSTPACEEMATAAEGVYPRVIGTLPSPRRLLEIVVDHADVIRIDTDNIDALSPRPEGVDLLKRAAAEGISGEGSSGMEDGGLPHASHVGGGWRFDGYAQPSAMPIEALDRNAWLHQWTIRTVERRLGTDPTDEVVDRTSLLVVYLATVPGALIDNGSDPHTVWGPDEPPPLPESAAPIADHPARIGRVAFLDMLATRLDRHRGPPQELLEELVRRPEVGLESEGWIAVVCRDDGSATYYLPPTKAHHRVTNADTFCAALESRLVRGR